MANRRLISVLLPLALLLTGIGFVTYRNKYVTSTPMVTPDKVPVYISEPDIGRPKNVIQVPVYISKPDIGRPKNVVWPLTDLLNKSTSKSNEEKLVRYLLTDTYHCKNKSRMGDVDDGGWWVCLDEPFLPKPPCVTYSFGISSDWTFDTDVQEKLGCIVHSFDPSIGLHDRNMDNKLYFHDVGIADHDHTSKKKWNMKTFDSIRNSNGHNETIIDIVKMDVESSEWSSLPQMAKTGQLQTIKQLLFELHNTRVNQALGLFTTLEKAGFRKYLYNINWHCGKSTLRKVKIKGSDKITECFELYFINSAYV